MEKKEALKTHLNFPLWNFPLFRRKILWVANNMILCNPQRLIKSQTVQQ
jgi:hypothetical protein